MEFDAIQLKRRRGEKVTRYDLPNVLIHVVSNADDATSSCFTEQSWKVLEPIKYFEYS